MHPPLQLWKSLKQAKKTQNKTQCTSPGRLLPLHLSVLVKEELLHLGEERVGLVAGVIVVLAQDELHALGGRRH